MRKISSIEAAYGMQFNPRGYVRDFDNTAITSSRVPCPAGCGLYIVLKGGQDVWNTRHYKSHKQAHGVSLAERLRARDTSA